MKGGCVCGQVRYELTDTPMIVHACHCTWCQRETGSAFAVNALIEMSRVTLLAARPEPVLTPSNSGSGQTIVRCPKCRIAVWSHYSIAGEKAAFIRVGTLDHPHAVEPDIHIFTSTQRRWVVIPEGARSVPEYYSRSDVWSPDMLRRWSEMMAS